MHSRGVGAGLLFVGVVLFLVAAGADRLGLGGAPGFGWKQLAGVVLGVAVAGAGLVRLRSARG